MRIMTIGRAVLGGFALLATASFGPAFAQSDPAANFPNRPIRMIIPFGAGGGNDLFARLVGQKFSEFIGQTVVIENKPGAGGRLAAAQVMEMPADGYTLFVGASGAMSVAAAIYPNLTYHATKTYHPLTMTANFPLILVVGPNHPAKTVKELVEWAKKNPEKSNYASSSPAFIISNELLKLKSGMPSTMIPYKSSNEMILSVIGGQTMMTILDGPPAMPMIKGGKVRALAVTGSERSGELPNVPSMAEAGYPEVNTKLWSGFFVHGKTPPAIAAKLESALRRAIADPGVNAKLKGMAVNPGGNSAAEFRAMIDKDIQGYVEVVKAAKLKFN